MESRIKYIEYIRVCVCVCLHVFNSNMGPAKDFITLVGCIIIQVIATLFMQN